MKYNGSAFPIYNYNNQVVDFGLPARDYVALRILAAHIAGLPIDEWGVDARLRAARAAFRLADSFIEASQEEM